MSNIISEFILSYSEAIGCASVITCFLLLQSPIISLALKFIGL